MNDEFRETVARYRTGNLKNMSRFDKMKRKEELGIDLKANPLTKSMRKVDVAIRRQLLVVGFLALSRTN